MVENIEFGGKIFAIIVSGRFREPGIHFFTPSSFSQQVGHGFKVLDEVEMIEVKQGPYRMRETRTRPASRPPAPPDPGS